MTTHTLTGTWFISGIGEAENEVGILALLTDGRAIQFPSSTAKPRLNQTMRLWYRYESATLLRFSLKYGEEGWIRTIEETHDGWIMSDESGIHKFPCIIAPEDALPEWYPELLEKNLDRMNKP
ncbi:hypothetical protein SAMN02745181_0317 [Rubritalea squalenifaciens DSM 18772]|uniref:Lipocalin-like domain-containing protein n=1 Tax=Rubritalea squalenifaciens DSM 18772 TaxID=1123071 RepID=A0A1M6BVU9_9BACT|nr:hypothetical protein [Rubritalea squalenifaciens]SHI52608.1 hypothetical protein SAMN02745181_0317 [Rubritalea squalenifaciens DSM 18772]